MTAEQPLPTNRALLHAELSNETAKALVALTGFVVDETEITALAAGAMTKRLEEVEKELDDAPPQMA